MQKTYQVKNCDQTPKLDGNFNSGTWKNIEPFEINNYMGDKPEYIPPTKAKLCYDENYLYVIFEVEDKFIKATAEQHQQSVCRDSCVEFFFTPEKDISKGYFNLEMNCGGTILLYHQLGRGLETQIVEVEDIERIEVFHSMGKIVNPEITKPTTWTVEYKIPLEMLEKYAEVDRPAPGVIWRANFYKCGDETSNPHWLTWSVIDRPAPDFHRPESFGKLYFE